MSTWMAVLIAVVAFLALETLGAFILSGMAARVWRRVRVAVTEVTRLAWYRWLDFVDVVAGAWVDIRHAGADALDAYGLALRKLGACLWRAANKVRPSDDMPF